MSGYLRFIKTWNVVVEGLCLLSSHRSCHDKVCSKKKKKRIKTDRTVLSSSPGSASASGRGAPHSSD